jgi:hypothetical protein
VGRAVALMAELVAVRPKSPTTYPKGGADIDPNTDFHWHGEC